MAWRGEAFIRTRPSSFPRLTKESVDSSFNLSSLFGDAKLSKVEDAVRKRLQREAEKRRARGQSSYGPSSDNQYSRDKKSTKPYYKFQ